MPIIKCNLVGFPYNEWKGTDLKQRLKESVGKRVVLVNEPENPRTPEAMAAMINFEMAAYVQETKCHDFFWYCTHSQCDVLEGSVTGYDLDECSLTVDVNVEKLLDVPERKVDEEVMAWDEAHRNFPVIGLMRNELKARALRKDILLLLTEHRKKDAVMENDLSAMERVMGIDVSREANEERRQIVELLKSSDDELARTWGHRLGCRLTEMGGREATLRRLRYILDEVTRTNQFQKLKEQLPFYEKNRLAEALEAMPHGLFRQYLTNAEDFASVIYYHNLPARALRRFVSILLLWEEYRRETVAAPAKGSDAEMMAYVGLLRQQVTPQWTEHYDSLWRKLIADDRLKEQVHNPGKQKGTAFNRNLVANIIHQLQVEGVYQQSATAKGMAEALEGDANHSVRQQLAVLPEKGIKAIVKEIVKEFVKES